MTLKFKQRLYFIERVDGVRLHHHQDVHVRVDILEDAHRVLSLIHDKRASGSNTRTALVELREYSETGTYKVLARADFERDKPPKFKGRLSEYTSKTFMQIVTDMTCLVQGVAL